MGKKRTSSKPYQGVQIRDKDIYEWLTKKAKSQDRSISAQLRVILRAAISVDTSSTKRDSQ